MTRIEAVQAMNEGKRVQHRYFSNNEWMQKTDAGLYQFEDGVICYPLEFWMDRKHNDWNDGWSLYENRPTILPSYP